MNRAKDESGDSEMDSVSDSDEVELVIIVHINSKEVNRNLLETYVFCSFI